MAAKSAMQETKLSPAKRVLLERLRRGSDKVRRGASTSLVRLSKGVVATSFAQQRLWFLDQLQPGITTYNMPFPMRLRGALDVAALQRSVDGLVERHESLRTTFASEGGKPVQVIAPELHVTVEVEAVGSEETLQERLKALCAEPFDLARGPLLRVRVLRLSATEQVLFLMMHHIVSDGWSMGVLFRELAALYAGYRKGEEVSLPQLPVQYADYAVWQREWLQGEELERQVGYWKGQLAGAPPVLELPTDRPRPAVQSYRGASYAQVLSPELFERLKSLARSRNATLFMVMLAAFQVLLARWTGQQDLVVGTPIAGRQHRELEGLIGLFLNALALRTDVSGDPDFSTVLARVKESALDAYAHQDLPFEKLVEELNPVRDASHAPIVQVMFHLHNEPFESSVALAGLEVQPAGLASETTNFDLNVHVFEAEGGLCVSLRYCSDLFLARTIEHLASQYEHLLESIVEQPECRISGLALLTQAEQAALAREEHSRRPQNGFDPFPVPDQAGTLVSRFESQVRAHGDRVAVKTPSTAWTYEALNARANAVAHALLAQCGEGLGRVGLVFDQDAPMLAGMLGVLKSGQAYVPLDPSYPLARLEAVMADAGIEMVVTDPDHVELVAQLVAPERRIEVMALEAISQNPGVQIDSRGLAYVLYTSGSTGEPKGVMQTHRNVLHHVGTYTNALHINEEDHLTLLPAYGFDAAVQDIYGALLNGATMYPLDLRREARVGAVLERINAEQMTILHCTPTVYRYLLRFRGKQDLSSVRAVVLGGEEARAADLELFKASFDRSAVFVNGLGPTESTLALQFFATHDTRLYGNVLPVGRAVAGTEVALLNEDGQIGGMQGEIAIRSAYVTPGYWNRPELTAAAFLEDPTRGEQRIYRTGDIGRRLPDGQIVFMGRADRQVKLRGFRIELGEIEAVLGTHPQVGQVVVLAREDIPGDKRLVAYVAAIDSAVEPAALREHVKQRLPDYMVPAQCVVLEKLPRLPNGKVDYKSLPAPERSDLQQAAYVAPRTPTEEILAGIWAEVLRLERVGVEDNFFELGGHSLLATQVVSRVRQVLRVELPLRELFAAPTLAGLAARLQALRAEPGSALTAPPLDATAEDGPMELSFAQQRLWFLDQIAPGGAAYNIAGALELDGALDLAALERALGALINRHEALRTVFMNMEGEPLQVVAEPRPWQLPVTDLSAERQPRERLKGLLREEASRGFDLARGPLFRAQLYRLAPDTHVLMLAMHHIISDGWSLGVITRELGEFYRGFARGEVPALPVLRVQYRDFARWQRGWLKGEVLEGELAHWRERLSGAPQVLELPTDRTRPTLESYRGAFHAFTFPRELVERLHGLARREGATLFMTLLSGFALLLARYSGQQDLLVGTPVANRNRAEIEGLVGFFVNTLVLRADLSGEPSVREFLGRMREVCLDAYAHQDLPFERLVEELRPARDMSRNPVFQVMFALQNAPQGVLELPRLTLAPVEVGRGAAQVDLTLMVRETPGGLSGVLNYATDLFDASTIARMGAHWRALLEAMVASPERRIDELPLLTEAERDRVVVQWNATAVAYPAARCVHELFEEQARVRPQALAVESGGRCVTYRELDARAEQLAQQLRKLGVRAKGLVAVYLERSMEMVVALLGVWKAGGAYVPIDPEYPAERVRFMLEDTRALAVLTRRSLAGTLPASSAAVLQLDAEEALPATGPGRRAKRTPMSPQQLAYVIYTSGSTGQPKGVCITHASLCNLICWHQQAYEVSPADRATQIAGPAFDASVWELWPYLTAGASVHIPDDSTRLDPGMLVRWLNEQRITLTFLPTPLAEAVLRERWPETTALRVLLTGGDRLSQRPTQKLPFRLINHYGPTENTVVSTCAEVQEGASKAAPPIGRPLPNTRAYVVDAHLQSVPVGVPGELLVGGVQLAAGYLNRPELSAQMFVPDPFGAESGARLYKTGDLVRYLPDGNIEFLGRIDQQVKIRGFRIELGEIEAGLQQHPAVREVVVIAREDQPGDKRLVAYVVANEDAPADLAERLRARLRASLPDYMVPSAFVTLEKLPLTPNGKVDRRALPAPERSDLQQAAYVAPRTPTEEILAGIWAEVLGLERVGVHDNFFELGGNSILSFQVIVKAKQARLRLLPKHMFQHQTIAELAAVPVTIAGRVAEQDLATGHVTSQEAKLAVLLKKTQTRNNEFDNSQKTKDSLSDVIKLLGLD